MANNENVSDPYIVLSFDQNTNMPELLSARALFEALYLHPPLVGEAMGLWTSPTELVVHISSVYFASLMRVHLSAGEEVKMATRRHHVSSQGSLTLRTTEAGPLRISIVDALARAVVSRVVEVTVLACAGQSILPSLTNSKLPNTESEVVGPKPSVRIRGITPITSRRAITIPSSSVDTAVCYPAYSNLLSEYCLTLLRMCFLHVFLAGLGLLVSLTVAAAAGPPVRSVQVIVFQRR